MIGKVFAEIVAARSRNIEAQTGRYVKLLRSKKPATSELDDAMHRAGVSIEQARADAAALEEFAAAEVLAEGFDSANLEAVSEAKALADFDAQLAAEVAARKAELIGVARDKLTVGRVNEFHEFAAAKRRESLKPRAILEEAATVAKRKLNAATRARETLVRIRQERPYLFV